jgi:hypothetical protein
VIEGVCTKARICEECWKDGTQLFVYLRFLYIFTPSMFAVHQFWIRKSVVRMILLHLVEETCLWSSWTYGCQEHWLKESSLVSCPIGGRSAEIKGNPTLYILWIKFKFWVLWSEQWMFQECKLCMLENLCVHTDWVLFIVRERERSGAAI